LRHSVIGGDFSLKLQAIALTEVTSTVPLVARVFLKSFFDSAIPSGISSVPEDSNATFTWARQAAPSCFLQGLNAPSTMIYGCRDADRFVPCGAVRTGKLLGRGGPSAMWVRNQGARGAPASLLGGIAIERLPMIRPTGRSQNAWMYAHSMRLARSGPRHGALGRQLSALQRRRLLRIQQQEHRLGAAGQASVPPFPFRPRPPS